MNKHRKIYLEYFNLENSQLKGFGIHHINGDKSNNDIPNLVAVPIDLHKRYHDILSFINENWCNPRVVKTEHYSFNITLMYCQKYAEYAEVYSQMCKWVDYREFLDKKIENIHKLSYSDN